MSSLRLFSLVLFAGLITSFFATTAQAQIVDPSKQAGSKIQPDNYYPQVLLETSMGDIVIELNRNKAPLTVNNFLDYVNRKEYDNTLFHRVIPDYIVQGGGYTSEFQEKKTEEPVLNESGNGLKNNYYSVAMARQDDPHSATRQFFFNLDENDNLDPGRGWGYTVFGTVTRGTEVIDAMGQVETEYRPLIRFQDVPKTPIVLISASVMPPL
jgi:peptidyl-prolyl cis-trans isomerase A (cyclophilin A)